MKRILVLFLFVLVPFQFQSFASNAELFYYDNQKIQHLFASIDAIDNLIESSQISFNEVITVHPIISNLLYVDSKAINFFDKGPDSLFGIPPFWWGFFLNWIGALLVYILTEHNNEYTKEAVIGFLVGTAIYVGTYYCCLGWGWWIV